MPSKDDLASERRAQILGAAAIVFARSGFEGARMDDIVAESGLSKGTLYWYFDSKQDIAVALFDGVAETQLQHVRQLAVSPGSVRERLAAFLDAYASAMSAQPLLGRLGIEIYAMAGRVPQMHEFIQHYYDEYIGVLRELLRQGQERGEFTVERPDELALNFACMIEGITLFWALNVDNVDLGPQFRSALQSLLQGVGTPG